ncbi:MAG TPA: hypothetical protein PKL34_09405, partial [Candidatus Cloacimonadota bacterium]|nr:hypothetical protein [Candidatus Cloacimonadota bacterium]
LPTPEPVQTTLSIEVAGTSVRLSISPVTGATSYQIFASDTPDGDYTDISSSGNFTQPTLWVSPLGDIPKRFYKAYAIR